MKAPTDQQRDKFVKIVELCQKMVDKKLPFLLTNRQLVSLLHQTDFARTEKFLVLISIDSETDALPLGEIRKYWEVGALRRLDPEIAEAELWAYETGKEACEALVFACQQKLGLQS